MLAKHPGLSAVSVIGIAVATAVGAGAFGVIDAVTNPAMPIHQDERVVSLINTNAAQAQNPDRQSLHHFLHWRQSLRTVHDLAAFSGVRRNLIVPGGATEPIRAARMTASGFRVARVAPLLGRPLLEADDRAGAPAVVVVAYDEWKRVFSGDPAIIGRRVRIGAEEHIVVGVMPEGFHFPVRHRYWIPLRLDSAALESAEGPELDVFGRLADGVTLEAAQQELTMLRHRMRSSQPTRDGQLYPRVLPFTYPFMQIHGPGALWMLRGLKLAVALLLVVVAVNVSILIYARTAARTGEIAVRTALGASRRRIVTQLFAEALVLSALAATIGLVVASLALDASERFLDQAMGGELPFWLRFGVSMRLTAYVAGLAVLTSVIVGVVPALKATGRDIQGQLQRLGSRGSKMYLGRTWTMLIVAQVAVAVAALPFGVHIAAQSMYRATAAPGYAVDEFLQASLWFEGDASLAVDAAADQANRAGLREKGAELVRRLESEPAVVGVTFATALPGGEGLDRVALEVDGAAGRHQVSVNHVDVDFFEVYGIWSVAGRRFGAPDGVPGANTAIVNRVLAERLLGDRDVVGRRVRRLMWTSTGDMQAGPWLRIVGVVPETGVQGDFEPTEPTLYQPSAPGEIDGALAVRLRSGASPAGFVSRLRALAAEVDPALHLDELRTAVDADREQRRGLMYVALGVVTVTASVLLLSAAGMFAMMSFIVARRRREIGIRAALGAAPGRLLRSIFARAGAQLGAGVLAGLALAVLVDVGMGGGPLSREGIVLIPAVAVLMLGIGLLAALVPARNGLAVQPTEALREE
jgi:predicted permease